MRYDKHSQPINLPVLFYILKLCHFILNIFQNLEKTIKTFTQSNETNLDILLYFLSKLYFIFLCLTCSLLDLS